MGNFFRLGNRIKILAENLNKPYEEIEKLCDRNNWFIGQEAVDLGIVDKVLCK